MKPITAKLQFLQAALADPSLSAPAKCVIAVLLLKHHNDDTGRCNPGLTKIAEGVGRNRRNVIPIIEELKQSGWVEITSTKGGPQSNSNQYRFDFSRRLTGDENDTGTGDEIDTGTSDENDTAGVMNTVGTSDENAPRTSSNLYEREGGAPRRAPDGAPRERDEESFAAFWRQYPKRQGEHDARHAFAAALASGADPKAIIAGAMRYAAERTDKPDQYTAMPGNWLRGGRWKDEPVVEEPPASRSLANGGGGHRRGGKPNPVDEMLHAGGLGRRA